MSLLQATFILFIFIVRVFSQSYVYENKETVQLIKLLKAQHSQNEASARASSSPNFFPIFGLVLVNTENGLVLGRQMESAGERDYFYAFRGIPYAEPPIGSLRFRPPVPYSRPGLFIDAREDRSKCIQPSLDLTLVTGSEDCLFVNVYVPQVNSERKLPVVVLIHGGGFLFGSSLYTEYGPDFLLDNDVIFVSFNYRLGPIGFLSTEDMVVPGNNGLKDQLLALKWVKNNIHSFGGDPNEITIMGQSAGSTSVSYLVQSDLAKGLFKRAVMLSGDTLCSWALARNPRQTAFQIGSLLGIQTSSSLILISALSILPAELIVLSSFTLNILSDNPLNLLMAPVKEPDHPDSIFSDRSYRIVSEEVLNPEDILMGFASAEGIFFIYTNDPNAYITESYLVPLDMHIENQTVTDIVEEEVLNYYYPNSTITLENAVTELSDSYFVRGITKYIKLASPRNRIFAYEFSYMGELGSPGTRTFDGVAHAEDLEYIFKHPNEPSPITESDEKARSRWVKLLTNFAIYGSPIPTPTELFQNIQWDPVPASGDLLYLDFGENLTMKTNPREDRMLFWDYLYDTYAVRPYDTY